MHIGPSTNTSPYLAASTSAVRFTSILTVGDRLADGGVFAGKGDGIGAFNDNGTIIVLINHELHDDEGLVRDHGERGAYVDRLVLDRATLQVVESGDLIQSVYLWSDSSDSYVQRSTAFDRLCSSDLAAPSAFFDPATGLGTGVRIYLTGEESGSDGRAFATILTGPNTGTAFELPRLGQMSFENVVANPLSQAKTVVALTDDTSDGQVYFYIGQKQSSGSEIDRAGLTNGALYGLKVSGVHMEDDDEPVQGSFTLQRIGPGGDASGLSGGDIEEESDDEGVTGFLRPEDCAWDPDNPNVLYFATTASFSGPSRLYQLTFTDIRNPTLGGEIVALLDGSEGHHTLDNLTVGHGKIILQEDPGDRDYLAKVWEYDIATGQLRQLAQADPNRFDPEGSDFITNDEESSGVVDVTGLLGDPDTRAYLMTVQAHEPTGDRATVQHGQFMVMYVDGAFGGGGGGGPAPVTLSFRQGSGYEGTIDTSVSLTGPDRDRSGSETVYVDTGNREDQGLLAFTGLFGNGPGQVPIGATITSATLSLYSVNPSDAGASVYRILVDWDDEASWNSLGDGLQIGVETLAVPELSSGAVDEGRETFDVTASLMAWLAGAATAEQANAANKGWAFIANSPDGWDFLSSESDHEPVLRVTYTLGTTGVTVAQGPDAQLGSELDALAMSSNLGFDADAAALWHPATDLLV